MLSEIVSEIEALLWEHFKTGFEFGVAKADDKDAMAAAEALAPKWLEIRRRLLSVKPELPKSNLG